MSLTEKILKELWNTSLSYKGMRVNMFGIAVSKKHSNGSIRTTLFRLHKNGMVEQKNNNWYITPLGKKYINKKQDSLKQFENSFKNDAPKNLIVMFDIPEAQKSEREWFRWHLKKFKYIMVQKSVWVGPSPLPKEFMDYVSKIRLKNTIKTFKLARAYPVKK